MINQPTDQPDQHEPTECRGCDEEILDGETHCPDCLDAMREDAAGS